MGGRGYPDRESYSGARCRLSSSPVQQRRAGNRVPRASMRLVLFIMHPPSTSDQVRGGANTMVRCGEYLRRTASIRAGETPTSFQLIQGLPTELSVRIRDQSELVTGKSIH